MLRRRGGKKKNKCFASACNPVKAFWQNSSRILAESENLTAFSRADRNECRHFFFVSGKQTNVL